MRLLLAILPLALGGCAVFGPSRGKTPPAAPLKAEVQVQVPRWQPLPVVGRLVEVRADSVWIAERPEAPPPVPVVAMLPAPPAPKLPLAVPVACITELNVWREGNRQLSASRGTFLGAVAGLAVGVFVSPEPTAWKLQTAPMVLPAAAVGTAVGAAIGWSRPGGEWVPASLGISEVPAGAVCTPRPAPRRPAPARAAPARRP